MATKKSTSPETSNTNSNVNNNHVNVNVKIKQPRKPRKKSAKKVEKPNWVLKLLVGGLITVGVLLVVYYLTNDTKQKPPVIQTQPLQRN